MGQSTIPPSQNTRSSMEKKGRRNWNLLHNHFCCLVLQCNPFNSYEVLKYARCFYFINVADFLSWFSNLDAIFALATSNLLSLGLTLDRQWTLEVFLYGNFCYVYFLKSHAQTSSSLPSDLFCAERRVISTNCRSSAFLAASRWGGWKTRRWPNGTCYSLFCYQVTILVK